MFFGHIVPHSLLFGHLLGESGKCAKEGHPLLLAEVVGYVVHILDSPGATILRIKPLSGSDEVAAVVHSVCPVNLVQDQYQCGVSVEVRWCDVLLQLLVRGRPMAGFQALGPQLG